MSIPSANEIITAITQGLPDRQREVILGRFGLGSFKEPQTLASLGDKYGVTRERIRQIENAALKSLEQKVITNASGRVLLESAKKKIKSLGGLAKSDILVGQLKDSVRDLNDNHLSLLITASKSFSYYPEDEEYYGFYYLDDKSLAEAKSVLKDVMNCIQASRSNILSGKFDEVLKNLIKSKKLNKIMVENVLAVSKMIHRNSYGDVGLAAWPEIKPTTVRDKVYLILKKSGTPLHFETIASTINQMNLSEKSAIPATVHNELIKDERFVLVGRGMYALKEHGFEPGTAQEVIKKVLNNNGPLKPKDIVLAVQRERLLKPNTILVNLQNKGHFERLSDGTYRVRES